MTTLDGFWYFSAYTAANGGETVTTPDALRTMRRESQSSTCWRKRDDASYGLLPQGSRNSAIQGTPERVATRCATTSDVQGLPLAKMTCGRNSRAIRSPAAVADGSHPMLSSGM